MTYATQQDLIDRFGNDELLQLADRDLDDAVDAAVVDGALADADELINTYIRKQYKLPLATAPDRLVKLAADIARYNLHEEVPTEHVTKAYDDALKFLKDIAAGRAELDVAGVEPEAQGDAVKISASDRVFTSDTMEGF